MGLSVLILTACVSLSNGCSSVACANTIEAIKQSIDDILLEASDYDYTDSDLTFETQESIMKEIIYNYAVENILYYSTGTQLCEPGIIADLDSIYYRNNDTLRVSSATVSTGSSLNYSTLSDSVAVETSRTNSLVISTSSATTASSLSSLTTSNVNNLVVNSANSLALSSATQLFSLINEVNASEVTTNTEPNISQTSNIVNKNGLSATSSNLTVTNNPESGGTSSNIDTLPIKSYDESNVTATTYHTFGDCAFLGIYASKDACINVYNIFAGWANDQLTYTASGSGSPLNSVVEALKVAAAASATTALGITATAAIASAISAVTGYLGSIWAGYIAMFTSAGAVGIIIGLIVTLLGLACIAVIASMIVFGYLGKGYAVGWKIYNLFHWEWYNGIID